MQNRIYKYKFFVFCAIISTIFFASAILAQDSDTENNCTDYKNLNIHQAIEKNCVIQLQSLLKNKNIINAYNKNGNTPLLVAVEKESIDIIKILLQHGANPDQFNQDKTITPIMLASFGNYQIVKLLIKYKANINLININKESALHFAVSMQKKDIVKLLLGNGTKVNGDFYRPVIHECTDLEMFTLLTAAGADPFERDKNGDFLIYDVALTGKPKLLQKLIEIGMDINSFSSDGFTPLMLAAFGDKLANVKILIANGAKLDIRSTDKHTALDIARINKRKDIILYLESLYSKKNYIK